MNTETLVKQIRDHEPALGELQGLLNQLVEVAQPKLVTDDCLTALKDAAAKVRAAKDAVLQHRRLVVDADRELDALMEKAGVPEAKITKAQTKLHDLTNSLDLCERRLKAALAQQAEVADDTRSALDKRHETQRHVGHELIRQFRQRAPEQTFRHVIDRIVAACDSIVLRALAYDMHGTPTDDIADSIKGVVERPLPESEVSARREAVAV